MGDTKRCTFQQFNLRSRVDHDYTRWNWPKIIGIDILTHRKDNLSVRKSPNRLKDGTIGVLDAVQQRSQGSVDQRRPGQFFPGKRHLLPPFVVVKGARVIKLGRPIGDGKSNSLGVCVMTASLETVAVGSFQSICSPFFSAKDLATAKIG